MMAEPTEHHDTKTAGEPEAREAADAGLADAPEAANENSGREKVSGFASPLEFLNAELTRLEDEKRQATDRYLRLAAEMENLRKRTARDVADARDYSIAAFAREMLAVGDNLRRALAAIPEESREAADPGLTALIEGVELTERSMLQALERQGVKKISPKGERFNPNFHQAMFEIEDAGKPAGTVLEVVQDGYVIGERMLRPALVGVAKGGPKSAAKAELKAEEDTSAK
jgi:molecular chaperone GrpE